MDTSNTSITTTSLRYCGHNRPAALRAGVEHCGRIATVRQVRESGNHQGIAGYFRETVYRCEDHRLPVEWVETTHVRHAGWQWGGLS